MLVAFAKAKSWGLSTAVLAVASWWPPERPSLVAEFDPAGGDLAPRYGLSVDPGLLSLAATARRGLSEHTVSEHAQVLPGGVRAVLGPPSADQAHTALRALAGPFASAMARSDLDVLADCGRLGPASPAAEMVEGASLTVLVARSSAEELAHLHSRVALLRPTRARLGVVLVGQQPYGPGEVADAMGVEVIGVLPDDRTGAALMAGHTHGAWGARRSALMRAAREVSEVIRDRCVPAPEAHPPLPPPARPMELTEAIRRRGRP